MNDINTLIKENKDLKSKLEKSFKLAMEDKEFASICYKLNAPEKTLIKYTTKIENTVTELKNCKNCKSLDCCKNKVNGCVNFPEKKDNEIVFSYMPCKYKKESLKDESTVSFYETSKFLKEAKMKDIYLDDKSREEVLKYIKRFIKEFPNVKGIYLYGSFGSGKSYILNALLNEISKKGQKCVSVYYPTLLKKLKDSFSSKTLYYEQIFNELEMADILLIDDIGAENNTAWARDEVLGSLLQSRMDNGRITFFTSNFNLEELESHLSMTAITIDKIKARRIIERIKQLCTPISLIGENKRG